MRNIKMWVMALALLLITATSVQTVNAEDGEMTREEALEILMATNESEQEGSTEQVSEETETSEKVTAEVVGDTTLTEIEEKAYIVYITEGLESKEMTEIMGDYTYIYKTNEKYVDKTIEEAKEEEEAQKKEEDRYEVIVSVAFGVALVVGLIVGQVTEDGHMGIFSGAAAMATVMIIGIAVSYFI